jgi:hypothetical protein
MQDNVCFLIFPPQGFFMGTIMTVYDVAFYCFFHMVLEVFAQVFIIYIFRFFSIGFSKIVFILREIQALKGKCYNTNVYVCHLNSSHAGNHLSRIAVSSTEPPHPRMYKRKERMNE